MGTLRMVERVGRKGEVLVVEEWTTQRLSLSSYYYFCLPLLISEAPGLLFFIIINFHFILLLNFFSSLIDFRRDV